MQLNISADGRFVSFVSSQDLIGDDPSGAYSLYFRSLQTGFLRRVFSSGARRLVRLFDDVGQRRAHGVSLCHFRPWRKRATSSFTTMPKRMSTNEVFSIDSTNNVSYVGQGIGISGNGRYITFSLRSPTMFGSNFTQVMAIDRNARRSRP